MAIEVFKNFASAALTVAVTTTPAAGTIETWTVGTTANFPAITLNVTEFRCQVNNPSGTVVNPEIVIVRQIPSGTTVEVIRGQEGSPITPHNIGDVLTLVQTAAQMQPTPWANAPIGVGSGISAGWAYYGSGAKPGYRVNATGDLQLIGLLKNTVANSASTPSTVFQLPVGFRPDAVQWLSPGVTVDSVSGVGGIAVLTVDTAGNIVITPEGSGTVIIMSLCGVRFPLTSPV